MDFMNQMFFPKIKSDRRNPSVAFLLVLTGNAKVIPPPLNTSNYRIVRRVTHFSTESVEIVGLTFGGYLSE